MTNASIKNKKEKTKRLAELCELYDMSEARMEAEIDTIVASHKSLKCWFLDEEKVSVIKEYLDEARKGQ